MILKYNYGTKIMRYNTEIQYRNGKKKLAEIKLGCGHCDCGRCEHVTHLKQIEMNTESSCRSFLYPFQTALNGHMFQSLNKNEQKSIVQALFNLSQSIDVFIY